MKKQMRRQKKPTVAIYGANGPNYRGRVIARAMLEGFKQHDIKASVDGKFDGKVKADIALAYGWIHELEDGVFTKYRAAGAQFVFFDLGFWDRGETGHHRIAINDWDSATNNKRGCPDDRFAASGLKIRNRWKPNSKNIMIAGMSAKAAWTHGYRDKQWENDALLYLKNNMRAHGSFRMYIRPKPGRNVPKEQTPKIDTSLADTLFVISHHSNVAIDCLRNHVPYYVVKGAGKPLSQIDFAPGTILNPKMPTDTEVRQMLADAAYWQWDIEEMKNGSCWAYARECLL